jgi:hypothetical protein
MSKRKLSMLLLLSSGYMMALGCSFFGPLRLGTGAVLDRIRALLGLG